MATTASPLTTVLSGRVEKPKKERRARTYLVMSMFAHPSNGTPIRTTFPDGLVSFLDGEPSSEAIEHALRVGAAQAGSPIPEGAFPLRIWAVEVAEKDVPAMMTQRESRIDTERMDPTQMVTTGPCFTSIYPLPE